MHSTPTRLPIRIILFDFKTQSELIYPFDQLAKYSIRNQINFIHSNYNYNNDKQSIIIDDQIKDQQVNINRQRIQNGLNDVICPEIWWLIEFKQDVEECQQDSFKIDINDIKLIHQTNTNENQLIKILQSIRQPNTNTKTKTNTKINTKINTKEDVIVPSSTMEKDKEKEIDYFLITIKYKRKCDAFRAFGHVLGLTRINNNNHGIVKELSSNDGTTNGSQENQANDVRQETWKEEIQTKNKEEDKKPNHQNHNHNNHNHQQQEENTRLSTTTRRLLEKYLISHGQKCHFESLGIMIDCSRNGVLRVNKVFEFIRFIALMGLNVLQLYTEDTYEIKGEPFFGYFRGPYKHDELKEIDDYAYSFGIEVIPCIQTLGHLGQMLQWPRYGGMRDTHEVLLVGSEEVYKFIEKMIGSITKPLRSKKIHIGMDEAHGVSEGRYRQLFGHKDSSQVFTDHLKRVNQICTKLDLKPMIWSDMLFCLAAKNNSLGGYYDSCNPATPELVQSIPPEIELVYWDYYHTTATPYMNKINQHRDLNYKSPAMASGIWTWSRFWTALPFTIDTIRASMKAIKNPKSGVKHALTTIWGDEGNECDIWSALPGILFYSEHAYSISHNNNNNNNNNHINEDEMEDIDSELLKIKFEGICGGTFDDFVFASKLDDLESDNQLIDDKARFTPNLSKWLIWEEPFFSILSPQYAGYDLETHYRKLSEYLDGVIMEDDWLPLNQRLKLPNLLAKILSLKCHLRDRLVLAYREKDSEELLALVGFSPASRLSKLRHLVDQVWKYHRNLWMSMYKPFGWEVLELRYGGLRARLETMQERINDYLNGKLFEIEELEINTQLVYPSSGAVMMLDYHRVSRPQYC